MPPRRSNARASLAANAKLMLARLEAEALPIETAGACTPEETERWRKIQMRRLELLIQACWGNAVTGDMGAIEQARRLLGDQIRVMGIDGSTPETPAAVDTEEVAELMRLAGYEVRRIEDGGSKETDGSGDRAGATETQDLARDGADQ